MAYLSLRFISFHLAKVGFTAFFEYKKACDKQGYEGGEAVTDWTWDKGTQSFFFGHKDEGDGDHSHEHRWDEGDEIPETFGVTG